MPRDPLAGSPPLTGAERQAIWRQRKAAEAETMRKALEQIRTIRTAQEAREIATAALGDQSVG